MAISNRQWLLAKRPHGAVGVEHFRESLQTLDESALADGEALVRVLWLGFDPAMRGWMDDVPSYLPPAAVDEPMRASGVGEVIASRNAELPVGALVQGFLGWQEYYVSRPDDLVPLTALPEGTPPSLALSVFGATSLTAYFGLLDVAKPSAGETVLVSGAAGATGSVAAQIAKLKGCRVIGIAGGAEKCRWLLDECKLDAAIDYKNEDLDQRLAELASDGVDVFFDNVGGGMLETAIAHMPDHGRIVLCGQISSYNDAGASSGLRNLSQITFRRLRLQGFVLLDYLDQLPAATDELVKWVMQGELAFREDVQHGFENIPATFLRLFSGANRGKQLLQLVDTAS